MKFISQAPPEQHNTVSTTTSVLDNLADTKNSISASLPAGGVELAIAFVVGYFTSRVFQILKNSKQKEDLQIQEILHKEMIENGVNPITIYKKNVIVHCNKAWTSITGYTIGDVQEYIKNNPEKDIVDLLYGYSPDEITRVRTHTQKASETGISYEDRIFTLQTKSGDFISIAYENKIRGELSIREGRISLAKKITKIDTLKTQVDTLGIFSQNLINEMMRNKDEYTGSHTRRVAAYTEIIAQLFGHSSEEVQELKIMAVLHDLGKLKSFAHILQDPMSLNRDGRKHMNKHPGDGLKMGTFRGMTQFMQGVYHHCRKAGLGGIKNLTEDILNKYMMEEIEIENHRKKGEIREGIIREIQYKRELKKEGHVNQEISDIIEEDERALAEYRKEGFVLSDTIEEDDTILDILVEKEYYSQYLLKNGLIKDREYFSVSDLTNHLVGKNIPYPGLLIAISDVIDAIASRRLYNKDLLIMPIEDIIEKIEKELLRASGLILQNGKIDLDPGKWQVAENDIEENDVCAIKWEDKSFIPRTDYPKWSIQLDTILIAELYNISHGRLPDLLKEHICIEDYNIVSNKIKEIEIYLEKNPDFKKRQPEKYHDLTAAIPILEKYKAEYKKQQDRSIG